MAALALGAAVVGAGVGAGAAAGAFDAGEDAALPPVAVLLGFALVFAGLAIWKFRSEAQQ